MSSQSAKMLAKLKRDKIRKAFKITKQKDHKPSVDSHDQKVIKLNELLAPNEMNLNKIVSINASHSHHSSANLRQTMMSFRPGNFENNLKRLASDYHAYAILDLMTP